MPDIAFIDHAFHQKTNSSRFFTEILSRRFSVEHHYFSPGDASDDEKINAIAKADIIVIWQMDFMAPIFIAMGKPTVIVPMYDGSANMPDIHWMFSAKARYINFSLMLHEKTRQLGLKTLLLRYFPEPCPTTQRATFESARAFFWQRSPASGINSSFVAEILGTSIDSLHVHNAPDSGMGFKNMPPVNTPFEITESNWFADSGDYQRLLSKANIYIAPRIAEGIGMAFLEAMAKGMVVVASDHPTHNEYISNYVNGVLFNPFDHKGTVNLRENAASIGLSAWHTVASGHEKWLGRQDEILDWVEGTPASNIISTVDYRILASEIFTEYYDSLETYTAMLTRNIINISEVSDIPTSALLENIGNAIRRNAEGAKPVPYKTVPHDGVLAILEGNDSFATEGWSSSEGTHRWMIGTKSKVAFSIDFQTGTEMMIRFSARSLPDLGKHVNLMIEVNNVVVGVVNLSPKLKTYTVKFNGELLRSQNTIHFLTERCGYARGDTRPLSAAFGNIELLRT